VEIWRGRQGVGPRRGALQRDWPREQEASEEITLGVGEGENRPRGAALSRWLCG